MATTTLASLQANLAPTFFQGNATDPVQAIDIYGITDTTVVNSPVGKYNPIDTTIFTNLEPTPVTDVSTLFTAPAPDSDNPSLTTSSIKARLTTALNQPVDNLSTSLKTTLSQNVSQSEAFAKATVSVGGIVTQVDSADIPTIQALVPLITQITGNQSLMMVSDTGAEASVLATTLQKMIASGLSGSIEAVIDEVTTPEVVNEALKTIVQAAIDASDLTTLTLCLNHIGVSGILGEVPDTVTQLLKGYVLPATDVTQYGALSTALQALLNALEPGWDTYTGKNQPEISLAYFALASDDALKLLSLNQTYAVACLIARSYPPGSSLTALQAEYPYMLA